MMDVHKYEWCDGTTLRVEWLTYINNNNGTISQVRLNNVTRDGTTLKSWMTYYMMELSHKPWDRMTLYNTYSILNGTT